MRKALITAALAAVIVAPNAFAAEQATGAIKMLNPTKHELTLADGKAFELPKAWKPAGFKVGDKVTVSYEMKGNKMVASSVEHAG